MNAIRDVDKSNLRGDAIRFNIGDTVSVYVKIKEEGKTRLQVFEGIVIKKKGSGPRATFTVRRISYGEGVERTFPIHSPFIDKVEIKKKGAVRRAKLNYLRGRKGKKSKVEEKIEHKTSPANEDVAPREEGA